MGSFDKERKALVDALLAQDYNVPARLSEVMRIVPANVWDWNLFDEAVQRREILFDGVSVCGVTTPAQDIVDVVYDLVERDNGAYVALGGVSAFFRLKLIRQCTLDTAIKVLMRLQEWSVEDTIEMICAHAIDVADNELADQTEDRVARIHYNINELFGINVIPQPYAELIRDQLGAPTHNVERRKLEENVSKAEQRLSEAKAALETFNSK
jgi:Outer membrane protein/protective antigen OMA87